MRQKQLDRRGTRHPLRAFLMQLVEETGLELRTARKRVDQLDRAADYETEDEPPIAGRDMVFLFGDSSRLPCRAVRR